MLRITRLWDAGAVALAGEVDEDNCPGVAAALEELAAGAPEVHIDLAGLAFCDLAGLRVLVRLTAPGLDPGGAGPGADGFGGERRVVLHRVPRRLLTLLSILGWDGTPGLRVIAADEPR